MKQLVLSLFPGIGLLDMAFEEEGFCVVRGPDLLWGGDIRRFHPPAGKFDGVIGGPPCQLFTALRAMEPNAGRETGNLIPHFERCVSEAFPRWFLMENVPGAPLPVVSEYLTVSRLLRDVAVGGETTRTRRFTFGRWQEYEVDFTVDELCLHRQDAEPSVLGCELAKGLPTGTRERYGGGYQSRGWKRICELQGLPPDFDLPGFTVAAKGRAVGNGVPLAMGRAVARAVKRATDGEALNRLAGRV